MSFTSTPPTAASLPIAVLAATNTTPAPGDIVPGSVANGVTLALGDRILRFGAGDGSDGIYECTEGGGTRATDYNTATEVNAHPYVKVLLGSNAGLYKVTASSFDGESILSLTFAAASEFQLSPAVASAGQPSAYSYGSTWTMNTTPPDAFDHNIVPGQMQLDDSRESLREDEDENRKITDDEQVAPTS